MTTPRERRSQGGLPSNDLGLSAHLGSNDDLYGCGEVFGQPIPPDLCGRAVKFAATFSTPLGELPGTITVFCVVGPKAPASIEHAFDEGVTVVVPGIVNFNHPGGGDNIFVQTAEGGTRAGRRGSVSRPGLPGPYAHRWGLPDS